jgi:hypothetical protein
MRRFSEAIRAWTAALPGMPTLPQPAGLSMGRLNVAGALPSSRQASLAKYSRDTALWDIGSLADASLRVKNPGRGPSTGCPLCE